MTPGVTITSGTGQPGSDGSTIRVRGVGTLNNANPYILVDGIETGTFDSIDPNDIESISVLKDAASAAIYGSKAANGVILVTTKRGKAGKATVSYNGNVSFSNVSTLIDRLSSYDYARLYNHRMGRLLVLQTKISVYFRMERILMGIRIQFGQTIFIGPVLCINIASMSVVGRKM